MDPQGERAFLLKVQFVSTALSSDPTTMQSTEKTDLTREEILQVSVPVQSHGE